MSYRGIIFDFDGTLFDTMFLWEQAGERYLKTLGIQASPDLAQQLGPLSMTQGARFLKETYGLQQPVEDIVAGVDQVVEAFYFGEAKPKKGVLGVLQQLKDRRIPICIATATDRYLVEAALKRWDLLDTFLQVVTCSQVGAGKDRPLVYETAARCLGLEPAETLVVEDAYHGAKTAKAAGFPLWAVYEALETRSQDLKDLAEFYGERLDQLPWDRLTEQEKSKEEGHDEAKNSPDHCRQ